MNIYYNICINKPWNPYKNLMKLKRKKKSTIKRPYKWAKMNELLDHTFKFLNNVKFGIKNPYFMFKWYIYYTWVPP